MNMKNKIFEKHSKYQKEDTYRLIFTAVTVIIVMAALIRFNTHTFISSKLIVSPPEFTQSDQLSEDDKPAEPTPSPESLELSE